MAVSHAKEQEEITPAYEVFLEPILSGVRSPYANRHLKRFARFTPLSSYAIFTTVQIRRRYICPQKLPLPVGE